MQKLPVQKISSFLSNIDCMMIFPLNLELYNDSIHVLSLAYKISIHYINGKFKVIVGQVTWIFEYIVYNQSKCM